MLLEKAHVRGRKYVGVKRGDETVAVFSYSVRNTTVSVQRFATLGCLKESFEAFVGFVRNHEPSAQKVRVTLDRALFSKKYVLSDSWSLVSKLQPLEYVVGKDNNRELSSSRAKLKTDARILYDAGSEVFELELNV